MGMASTRDPSKIFFLFVLILTTLRLVFLATNPLDLAPDEAYYWDWSRHLDVGYYSKPPLIAWIIWLGTHLFGPTEFGVRFPALLLGTLSLIILFRFTRQLLGDEVALWATLLSGLTVGASIGSFIMTIDAPLILFWTLALLAAWNAIGHGEGRRPLWWLTAGVATGLGLLSKQTMIAFPALFFLYLLSDKGLRRHLLTPWPYIAFFIAIFMLSPTIYWNMDHGWITILHTKHHFDPNRGGLIDGLKTFGELFGALFGLLTPVTFCLILMGSSWAGRPSNLLDLKKRYLFFMGPMPLGLILLLSLHQRVNPNWPGPFFITSTILAALWAIKLDHKKALRAGVAVSIVITSILYAAPYILPHTPLSGGGLDPFRRLMGWEELGRAMTDTAQKAGWPREIPYIFTFPRQNVSELAFYMEGQPRIYLWRLPDGIKNQYSIWDSPLKHKRPFRALLVKPDGRSLKPSQIYLFKEIRPVKHVKVPISPRYSRGYWVYVGEYDPHAR